MKHGKNYIKALATVDRNTKYSVADAVALAKSTSTVKYDATIRVSYSLNVDPRHADQQIRGAIVLPNGTGKTQKVLVVTQGNKLEEAKNAGADYYGDKEILEKVKGGWFDFDVIVATPDMMGELGKLGKILGPKGLMPNPKTGTVTPNIAGAVAEIKKGKVEYRVDKNGNINVGIGKSSFSNEALVQNYEAINSAIVKARPAAVKGNYINSVTMSSNMGPGIKVSF